MFRMLTSVVALAALSQSAVAGDVAQYGVGIGLSPFGGSLNLGYHASKKTTAFVTLGGAPSMEAPMKMNVDDTEYTQTGGSSWVGAFLNHRPFKDANWFRVNTGIGIGNIAGELEDDAGNTYTVEYSENPVGYIGVGVGSSAMKGMTVGFDLGWLQTGGPDITKVAGPGADKSDDIDGTMGAGNVLPNLQLSVGYNW